MTPVDEHDDNATPEFPEFSGIDMGQLFKEMMSRPPDDGPKYSNVSGSDRHVIGEESSLGRITELLGRILNSSNVDDYTPSDEEMADALDRITDVAHEGLSKCYNCAGLSVDADMLIGRIGQLYAIGVCDHDLANRFPHVPEHIRRAAFAMMIQFVSAYKLTLAVVKVERMQKGES